MRLKLSKNAQKYHEFYQNDICQKVKSYFHIKIDIVERKCTQNY